MTKTELQIALAAATQTNKRTAGVFLDTLSTLAYKAIKKNGEFVLPGFGKLASKAEEEGSYGRQSKDAREDQDSSQDCRQIPSRQGCKGRHSRGEEVV
jgi:nucleoid DNA-binding protein